MFINNLPVQSNAFEANRLNGIIWTKSVYIFISSFLSFPMWKRYYFTSDLIKSRQGEVMWLASYHTHLIAAWNWAELHFSLCKISPSPTIRFLLGKLQPHLHEQKAVTKSVKPASGSWGEHQPQASDAALGKVTAKTENNSLWSKEADDMGWCEKTECYH